MKTLIYLFGFYPGTKFAWFYLLLVFFLLIFAISIVGGIFLKKQKGNIVEKTFKKLPGHLQVLSIMGLLLILARVSGVAFFSMRAFLFVLLGVLIAIIIANIRKYFIILPQKAVQETYKKEKDKYIPQRKKRKKRKKK